MESIWNSFKTADISTKVSICLGVVFAFVLFSFVIAHWCSTQAQHGEISDNKQKSMSDEINKVESNVNKIEQVASGINVRQLQHGKNLENAINRQNKAEQITQQNFTEQESKIIAVQEQSKNNNEKISEIDDKQKNVELEINKTNENFKKTEKKTSNIESRLNELDKKVQNNILSNKQTNVMTIEAANVVNLISNDDFTNAVKQFRTTQHLMKQDTKKFIAKTFAAKILEDDSNIEPLATALEDDSFAESIQGAIESSDVDSLCRIILDGLLGENLNYDKPNMDISNNEINIQRDQENKI